MNATQLDSFTLAYVECALWSSMVDDPEDPLAGTGDCSKTVPMDDEHTIDDIAPETLQRMADDCARFQIENASDIATGDNHPQYTSDERTGHDFWLTRNGHGAGFWDGDWPEDAGERLTAASESFGSFDLYVGDDGLIHGM